MVESMAAVLDALDGHLTAMTSREAGQPSLLSSRPRATVAAAASSGSRAAKKAEKKAAKKEAKKQGHRCVMLPWSAAIAHFVTVIVTAYLCTAGMHSAYL
jgi:hypothetical protein